MVPLNESKSFKRLQETFKSCKRSPWNPKKALKSFQGSLDLPGGPKTLQQFQTAQNSSLKFQSTFKSLEGLPRPANYSYGLSRPQKISQSSSELPIDARSSQQFTQAPKSSKELPRAPQSSQELPRAPLSSPELPRAPLSPPGLPRAPQSSQHLPSFIIFHQFC